MMASGSYPYTQDSQDMLDSTNSVPDFVNTMITDDESWVVWVRFGTSHFPCNENLTRALNTTSLKCCLSSIDVLITKSMAYGTRRFNAAFTRALQ